MFEAITLAALIALLAITLALFAILRRLQARIDTGGTSEDIYRKQLEQLRGDLLSELRQGRLEQQQLLQSTMKNFSDSLLRQQQQIAEMQDKRLGELSSQLGARQDALRIAVIDLLSQMSQSNSEAQRLAGQSQDKRLGELSAQLGARQDTLQNTVTELLKQIEERLRVSGAQNEQRLEQIRATVEQRLTLMQEENGKKLEQMRATVDEKLQKTLEERIGQSFKMVSDRLEQVYKGLGEMQNLATGVGDLKRVLSNVKTRGILGEMQLGAILEQILTPEQYLTNVATRPGASQVVEYAVRLPGDDHGYVLLPIDAKFPADVYSSLMEAYERGDAEEVETAALLLDRAIKSFARDIRDKYIEPPATTDFAIMFLPFEGLYAEVVRRGLMEILQRDYRVSIAGPTTMAALLNSLQMGFRTLAIQKRSSEVWRVLGAVKTEFAKFGGVLQNTQQRLEQANRELDQLVGVRTRQIQRKLGAVAELPEAEGHLLLGEDEEEAIRKK